MKHVNEVDRPLKIGEMYMVPCIVREDMEIDKIYITPVIDHPHSDLENGQRHIHYHADFRFIRYNNDNPYDIHRTHSRHVFCEILRPTKANGRLMDIALPAIRIHNEIITPSKMISKSKLKHDCIYKGKCPHRGYPMNQVDAVDGKLTCPLHGLQFDQITHKIIQSTS